MFCGLSGEVPEDPVVSKKTGHLYERRLIEKYIDMEGKDPITGEAMTLEDLLPLKANKPIRPRPVSATSIPGLLSLFQNEWDDLMLETYTLKQHLDSTRQELSQALYQYDAACRVIARLIKERDAARSQLVAAQSHLAKGATAANGSEAMDTGADRPGITSDVIQKITAKNKQLSSGRKRRTLPAGLSSADDIRGWAETSSHTIHKSDKPGILSVDIDPKDDNKVLTGGVDKDAKIFNKGEQQVEFTLSGHSKRVNEALFHPTADMAFTASSDKTVKVWTPNGSDGYSAGITFDDHSAEVTGIAVHATAEYVASSSRDGSWAFFDIPSGKCLTVVREASGKGLECVKFHPDGQVMGTGTEDSVVRIWDVTTQQNVATFEGHRGAVHSLSFSENGYYMASAATDGVRLWDLRKLKNFHTIETEQNCKAVAFDYSGGFLALGAGNVIRIFETKKWDELKSLEGHRGAVTAVKFGGQASSYLASTSMDRSLRIWG